MSFACMVQGHCTMQLSTYVTWLQGALAFQTMATEVRAQHRAAHLEAAADGEAGHAAKL